MWIFIIVVLVILFIIFITSRKHSPENNPVKIDYYTAAQNSYPKENTPYSNNDLYESLKRQHKNKTASEIRRYIDFRRDQDDGYWEYHRLEYKVLMEYQREFMNQEFDALTKKAANFNDETLYPNLLEAYNQMRYNKPLYPEVDFTLLESRLATQSDIYFKNEIKSLKTTGIEKWLIARRKEGHYITKEMLEFAKETENSEPPLDRLKRQRKNYQTAIAKAKKENNTYMLLKYEELLAKNTVLLNIEKNK